MWRVVLVGTMCGFSSAQDNTIAGGAADCPCVSPWVDTPAGDSRSCRELWINREQRWGRTNGTQVCVPLDYGASSCQAWDNHPHHPRCLTADGTPPDNGAPEWCRARWCYVDPLNCQRPHIRSDQPASSGDATGELVHSYETCGNLNAYTADRHYAFMRGQHLRVSFPGDSGSGYTILTLPDGTKAGSVVEFMRAMAQEIGFTWEVVPVGQGSRGRYNSSFTACVHSVALGAADLCIGNFWVTSERTLLHSSFTSTLYDDEILLVVPAVNVPDFWARIARPFTDTLTFRAWILVLVNMTFMSMAMAIIDRDEVGDGANKLILRLQHVARQLKSPREKRQEYGDDEGGAHDAGDGEGSKSLSVVAAAKELASSVYYGLLGLTAGAPAHEGRTAAGCLVVLGFGVFCLLFVSSYTGATAAILIAENEKRAEISSVDDIAKVRGNTICIMEAMALRFALRYPVMKHRLVESATTGQVLQDFDDQKCAAAVMFTDAWEAALTGKYPTSKNDGSSHERNHCDKVAVGGSIMSTANAMPVRHDLRESLSYLIALKVTNNEYSSFRNEAREMYIGADLCAGGDAKVKVDASIDEYALAGPLFVSAVLTACGLVVHAVWEGKDQASKVSAAMAHNKRMNEEVKEVMESLQKSLVTAKMKDDRKLIEQAEKALEEARQTLDKTMPTLKHALETAHTKSVDETRKSLQRLAIQAKLSDIWQKTDVDKSNAIEADEFETLFKEMQECTNVKGDAESSFKDIDTNGDGEIDFDELLDWWEREKFDSEVTRTISEAVAEQVATVAV